MVRIIDKIFSREYFFYYTIFYLTCKLFPSLQSFSILTYIMFIYSVLIFAYNRLIKRFELTFPCCWFSYGILVVSIVSVIINGYVDLRKVIIDIIPIFVNLFLFFPTFKDDNFDTISDQLYKLMIPIYFVGLFVSILNLLSYGYGIASGSVSETIRYRMFGILGNPNLVGWFETVFIGTIIYFKNNNNKLVNKTIKFSFVLSIICVLLSQCRSAFLALFVYFVFCLLTTKKVNSIFKKRFLLSIISVIILISLFLAFLILYDGRFGSNREDVIRFALYNFSKSNKLFGASYGRLRELWVSNYHSFFQLDSSLTVRDIFAEANTHNILLQQLCTNGIVGLMILLMFIIILVYCILKFLYNYDTFDNKTISIIIPICYFVITGLVVGMFDNSILQSMTLFMNFTFLVSAGFLLKLSLIGV